MMAQNFLILWASTATLVALFAYVYITWLRQHIKVINIDAVCVHLHHLKNGEDVISIVRIWKNSEYNLDTFKSLLHKACLERDTFYLPKDAALLYYRIFNETLPNAVFSPSLAP